MTDIYSAYRETAQTLKATDGALLLHNREAEEAVVGSVLINEEVFHDCRVILTEGAKEFGIHRNGFIWRAFEELVSAGTPIDLLTLSEQLQRNGQLEDVGGSAYLTSLISQVPSTLNAASYASIVHSYSLRRQMIFAADEIAKAAYDMKSTMDEVASRSTTSLNLVLRRTSSGRMVSISDSVALADKTIETNSQQEGMPGIQTPLADLNKLMGGGAQKSDANLIAGRPGQGKTSLLLQIAAHAAKYKIGETVETEDGGYGRRVNVFKYHHVAVFSGEMPHEQLTMRLLSMLSGIDYQTLRGGKLKDEQWEPYYMAISELSSLDVYIDDTPKPRPSYIRSRCEILASQGQLDMVCVDSLNLMTSDVDFRGRTDLATDYNAQELKNIAREFDVPVWAAHQFNRYIERRGSNSKPSLADLAEGGERPVDGVFFIYHEYNTDKEDDPITADTLIKSSSIVVGKQRNGPTGEVPVYFNKKRFKFESVSRIKLN
jgi:replicative DNA helicase